MRSRRSGVTSPKQLAAFRQTHSATVRKGEPKPASPRLPSEMDPSFAYGMPSSHRSAESVRNNGREEPKMKHLVQVGWRRSRASPAAGKRADA